MEEQFVGRGNAQARSYRSGIYNASSLRHLLRWMRFFEQLLGYLTEVVDETDSRIFLQRIINAAIETLLSILILGDGRTMHLRNWVQVESN